MAGRAGALWLCTAAAVLCAAAELRLTLLHTNDVHGRVEAQGAGTRRCAAAAAGCFGGVARRAARVAAERAAHRNVLLLDAGDQYQGTVWFSHFKGREAVHFMNLLRYDAMVKRAGGGRRAARRGAPTPRSPPRVLGLFLAFLPCCRFFCIAAFGVRSVASEKAVG